MSTLARLLRAGRQVLGDISNQNARGEKEKSKSEKDLSKPGVSRTRSSSAAPHGRGSVVAPAPLPIAAIAPSASVEPELPLAASAPAPAPAMAPAPAPAPASRGVLSPELYDADSSPLVEDAESLEDSMARLHVDESPADEDKDDDPMSQYISDIVGYLRKTEMRRAPSASYMTRQTDINSKMREILVDWLVEVHLKFKLRLETLYLTVNLVDRFLERRVVKRNKLQLVGVTSMLLASKYEEIYAPTVNNFVYITDNSYTKEQIVAMEAILLNTLKFNLTVPYSLQFAKRYIKIAGGNDKAGQPSGAPVASGAGGRGSVSAPASVAGAGAASRDAKREGGAAEDSDLLALTTFYFLELHLQKYQFLQYRPSLIAASALLLTMRSIDAGEWDEKLVKGTEYTEAELEPCVRELSFIAATPSPKYGAVKKKYSSDKYLAVAKNPVWTPDGPVTLS